MENQMTIKDVLKIMHDELVQVNVPAEQTFTIGVHVGRALMLLKDCISAIEQNQQTREEEEKTVPLFPQEEAEPVKIKKEIEAGLEEKSE